MIYKFKCRATSDLLMMGPQGDQLLRLLGREPAAQGILEVPAMPAAVAALQAAVAEEAAALQAAAAARPPAKPETPTPPDADEATMSAAAVSVSLRQRVWPMVEMLQRALAAGQPVVWGV